MENISLTLSARPVNAVFAARVLEDVGLIADMLRLVPEGREDWRPAEWPGPEPAFTVGELRVHLGESLGGVCACLQRLYPAALAHWKRTTDFAVLERAAGEGFALLADADLTRPIPTVFSSAGVPFLETLLINWKHLLLHGYQLFVYLKLLGVAIDTRNLYRLRE